MFKLEKPIAVWCLATCFILALPANLAFALRAVPNSNVWYFPTSWWQLYTTLSILDQLILATLPCAGGLLFIQRRTSWLFAVMSLLLITIFNIFVFLTRGLSTPQIVTFSLINISILTVFYFFRFPYLDKRDQLFKGIARRYLVNEPVLVDGFHGEMKNVSETGAFVEVKEEALPLAPGQEVTLEFEICLLKALVIHNRNRGYGVRFTDPRRLSTEQLQKFLKRGSRPS